MLMADQTNNHQDIELQWSYKTKEQMAQLVSELYEKIGFSAVGNSRPAFPIYDLGHSNRGFETFPKVLTLSGLEDCVLDESDIEGDPDWDIPGTIGLKAKISAPTLLNQLHSAISRYLNSDQELHPEWYSKKLEALKDAVKSSAGIHVALEMKAEASEKPQYELESYSML